MNMLLIGGLCGVVGCLIVEVVYYILAWKQAERVMKPDEKVLCRNATILMDSHGEIAWVNNDRVIPSWKK